MKTTTSHPKDRDSSPAKPAYAVAQADQRPAATAQRQAQATIDASPRQVAQRQHAPAPRPNATGLPDRLKTGVERLSGHSLDDVRVHYNSARPAQLQALAYAQGTDIHVGPGQEKHLPHEAWHVVQQKQGRVRATRQLKSGVPLNDDIGLEREADTMGRHALSIAGNKKLLLSKPDNFQLQPIQRTKALDINERGTQRLKDPDGMSTNQYDWDCKFAIYIPTDARDKQEIEIIVFLTTSVTDAIFNKWRLSIEKAWNNKFAVQTVAKKIYPITVSIDRATATYSNYTIEHVDTDTVDTGRGLFGTESMTKWGTNDPQDIPHEVGHMLGNKDEYGTVDGVNYTAKEAKSNPEEQSIMGRGDWSVRGRHFNLILTKINADGELGKVVLIDYSAIRSKSSQQPHSIAKQMLSNKSQEIMGISQAQHLLRVKKIDAYLQRFPPNAEQKAYLAENKWQTDPKGSEVIFEWLGF